MHTLILSLLFAFNASLVAPDGSKFRKIDRKYLCQQWVWERKKSRGGVWVYKAAGPQKNKRRDWYGREHRIMIYKDARLTWYRPVGCSRDRGPFSKQHTWEWKAKKNGTILFILDGHIRYKVLKLTKDMLQMKSDS